MADEEECRDQAQRSADAGLDAVDQRPRLSHPRPHLRRHRRRRRRRRFARHARLRGSRPQDRVRDEGVPDALAYRCRAGRRRGRARQHGAGRLALAHVRHREGRRLARRPGRHRIPVPQRAGRRVRDGALRRAVLAHRGRQDLPAAVRRHDHRVRRGPAGAAHVRRRRPYRPRHAAHAVRPGAALLGGVLHRILRARSADGPGRRLPRYPGAQPRGRVDPPVPRQEDHPGDGRLRPRLLLVHVGAHLHRRRQRHGAARRPAAAGHGVRAVPSDRHLRRRRADHRGRARRGRLSDECAGRALHGALCAARQGSRLARRRLALDDRRDSRRPRTRAPKATTSTCTSTISIRRSWRNACRASPRAPRCSPASTCAASRSRCCRPCITTWAASPRTITARC